MVKNLLKNWKTTLAGLSSLFAGIGLIASALSQAMGKQQMPDMQALGGGLAAFATGAGLLAAADADKVPPVAPVALALLLGGLLWAAPAQAQVSPAVITDPGTTPAPVSPPLGGTFRLGTVQAVYGPRLLPGMLALDFKTGSVNAVAIGGLAYGVDFWADRPYSLGVAGFLGAQTGSPASISTGLVATAFHYAVIGWHHGVTGGVKTNSLVVGPSVAF